MGIGNLGLSEIVIIAVIVLVFFGPARMPEIARSMGSALRDFKRSLNELQRELDETGRETVGDTGRGGPRHRPGPRPGEPVLPAGGESASPESAGREPPARESDGAPESESPREGETVPEGDASREDDLPRGGDVRSEGETAPEGEAAPERDR